MNRTQTPGPVVDTASPSAASLYPPKPSILYAQQGTGNVTHALNASAKTVNATFHNVTRKVVSAGRNVSRAVAANTSSSTSSTTTTTTTTTTTSAPWMDDLNKMTTTSVSENASRLSLVHLFAWFLLFATLTMTTVVLLNWCLRSRQSDEEAKEEEEEGEEMPTKAFVLPSSSSTQGTLAEGPSSASSSSNRLLASRGNLARQQFLESRKTGGNVKNYGSTDAAQ